MRGIRVWARLLGLARAVVEDVFLDGEAVVVCVRPRGRLLAAARPAARGAEPKRAALDDVENWRLCCFQGSAEG